MTPTFFKTPEEFRNWLAENHLTKTALLVGFYKVDSGKPSITWPQSVDEALCFGWIDGVRKSIDEESYYIRFTPRKPTSIWSAVNIRKVEELIKSGQMQQAGLVAYENRKTEKSKVYSFENESKKLTSDFENHFKANAKAWDFFTSQASSYKKAVIHWIMTAKQEVTQLSRLGKVISDSENQKRLWDKYKG